MKLTVSATQITMEDYISYGGNRISKKTIMVKDVFNLEYHGTEWIDIFSNPNPRVPPDRVKFADITLYNNDLSPGSEQIILDINTSVDTPPPVSVSQISGTVNMQIIQDKFTRDHDPTVNDDMNSDYNVFCQWKNSVTGDLFQCMDNTPGAAIWKKIQFVEL